EIQFHKKALKQTSREERQALRDQENWSWLTNSYRTSVDFIVGLPEQAYQGQIIRQLNKLEMDLVAADLSGDGERIEATLKKAREALYSIGFEHNVNTLEVPGRCGIQMLVNNSASF
ncbi:MAG: hypothetical protein AAF202_10690, partial [Pseudomonadota bacterium]